MKAKLAHKKFSGNERIKSIGFAFEGILAFFRTEHNARIHFAATIMVVVLSVIFPVNQFEAIVLIFAIVFVWVAELFNTAIERVCDTVSIEKSPAIKFIKDVSSGAVLLAALSALIAGCMIFIPKIFVV